MKNRNITKYTLIAVGIVFCSILTGCSEARARAQVMARFPNAEVVKAPDTSSKWIVRTRDGKIYWATCDGIVERNPYPEGVYNIVEVLPSNIK